VRSPPCKLTVANPIARIHAGFIPNRILVDNPTANIVLLRFGGDATPDLQTADLVIPAASSRVWPISSGDCVAAFSGTASTAADVSSGLATEASLQLLDETEPDVAAASLSFLNLSLSIAASAGPAATGTLGPFDLSTWGGLVISGAPTVNFWDQQGWCAYETSANLVTWTRRVRLPLWPGMQLSAQLPRFERYARVTWQPYGAPWAAAPTFSLVARPTLEEVLAVVPALSGSPPAWAYSGAQIVYVPGDLVASIAWYFDNTAAGTTATVQALGFIATGGGFGQILFMSSVPTGTARKGTWADPWPIVNVTIGASVGVPAGNWGAVPHILPGYPDSLGQNFDTVLTPTIPGFLNSLNNRAFVWGAVTDAAGTLTQLGQLRQLVAQTAPQDAAVTGSPVACGAGVWTTSGLDLPAGGRIVSINAGASVAGIVQVGVGTAGAVAVALGAGLTNVTAPIGQPWGYLYGANTRVWLYSQAAATVWWNIYTI